MAAVQLTGIGSQAWLYFGEVHLDLAAPQEEITGHGFGSISSTLLNELGQWRPDVIERQLAHQERNKVRAAYNHAQYLSERTTIMHAWADYLDTLKQACIEPAQSPMGSCRSLPLPIGRAGNKTRYALRC